MIRAITREVHYTFSCSSIDIEDTIHTCLGGVGDRVAFVFISVFFALVCLFMCLFMCFLFRVSLVFMSVPYAVFVCRLFLCFCLLGVPCFSLSRVLGLFYVVCVSDAMIANQGSLLTSSNLFGKT